MKEFRKTDDLLNSLPQAEVIISRDMETVSKMMKNYECYPIRRGG